MKKTVTKLPPEKLAKIKALQDSFKNPFAGKLKELENALIEKTEEGFSMEEAAQKIGTTEQGIRDILATTHCSTIETFLVPKGQKEIWYIKIKKKQP
ncbi:hypothetical protein KJ854_02925 [Patescibacteria group bacterium]|nr:hypothetical protein [Patescibacteria group bacterium]MBU4142012.1 hypothetical protein [Patescibacteria group bacterium]